jgi:hypothetical protein
MLSMLSSTRRRGRASLLSPLSTGRTSAIPRRRWEADCKFAANSSENSGQNAGFRCGGDQKRAEIGAFIRDAVGPRELA